jgi:hypothetical protein
MVWQVRRRVAVPGLSPRWGCRRSRVGAALTTWAEWHRAEIAAARDAYDRAHGRLTTA